MTSNSKNKANKSAEQALSFEDAYNRLTETARKLEQGGLPLEESLALFEEGVKLARRCEELLSGAELRISQIMPATASPTLKSYSFSTEEDDEVEYNADDDDDEDWNDEDLRNALNELKI